MTDERSSNERIDGDFESWWSNYLRRGGITSTARDAWRAAALREDAEIERLTASEAALREGLHACQTERDRLRAALERLDVWATRNYVGSVTFETIRKIARAALSGEHSAPETDWRQMREHELRHVESVLATIRGQYGDSASETAIDALAWVRNRLTVGSAENGEGD